ncbi:hypothetical protein HanPI659440_Chr13g0523291 [Helianthus annuus]|nr:hypothetical protein HanPI659440_Chr13g0523291 [Helianthus annuus]
MWNHPSPTPIPIWTGSKTNIIASPSVQETRQLWGHFYSIIRSNIVFDVFSLFFG